MPTEPTTPVTPPVEPTITNPPTEGENPTEKRIKALSGKVETIASERDSALLKLAEAEKKAQFAEAFTTIVSQHPAATEFKTQIQEKVLGGYTPQDAAYAVLGAAGKLGNPQAIMAPITGGSAPTIIPNQGSKNPNEMNRDELRAALLEAQGKGDLYLS